MLQMSPAFLHQFVFPYGILAMPYKAASRKMIAKHNTQKSHIHIFRKKLLGEVAIILDVVSDCHTVKRTKVILTKNFGINISTK